MDKKEITTINRDFLQGVSEVLAKARKNAKTAVNLSMVYTYFEIGRMIVEEEQHGANRAAYGKQILKALSAYLTKIYGKGFSVTNLKQMRQFYLAYANDQIGQTLSDQFKNLPTVSTGRKFYLSWSHYLKLMRIDNIEERHFYEIESVKNDWSLSELKRQFNSALYERLLLSTDKKEVYRLALEGQKAETPRDIVKDPYILEFLGLPEAPSYSETEMESRIINHLQQFLLELGTGFAFMGRQYHINVSGDDYYIDILMYNTFLHRYLVIELKDTEFMPEYIGKLNFYCSAVDDTLCREGDNRTIGLLLCKSKDRIKAEYALRDIQKPIGISDYELGQALPKDFRGSLPTIEEIEKELESH